MKKFALCSTFAFCLWIVHLYTQNAMWPNYAQIEDARRGNISHPSTGGGSKLYFIDNNIIITINYIKSNIKVSIRSYFEVFPNTSNIKLSSTIIINNSNTAKFTVCLHI